MSPVPRRQPSSSTCSTASPPPGAGPWRFLVLQPLPSGEFSCLFTSLYWILPNNFCCKVIREGGSILDHPVIVLFFLCCPCTDRKQISSVLLPGPAHGVPCEHWMVGGRHAECAHNVRRLSVGGSPAMGSKNTICLCVLFEKWNTSSLWHYQLCCSASATWP